MANRYSGSYRSTGPRQERANRSKLPRGIKRQVQDDKMIEALARNEKTDPTRRAWCRRAQAAARVAQAKKDAAARAQQQKIKAKVTAWAERNGHTVRT